MKKKKIIKEEGNLVTNDFKKIYVYKRNFLLLNPVPYRFILDIKKINEMKQ